MNSRVAAAAGTLLVCLLAASHVAPSRAATAPKSKTWAPPAKAGAAPVKRGKAESSPAKSAATPAPATAAAPDFLPDSFVMCRVGDRVTRVSDFVTSYFNAYAPDRPGQDSVGRVTFLQNIVAKDVLGLTALEINRPFGFEDRVVMREHEQRALSNALYRTAVLESLQVSDEMIAEAYEPFQWELKLRRIRFADHATATRVRLDLIRGRTTWKQAYERYSLSRKEDRAPDGELGWLPRGGLPLDFVRKVFSVGPGGYSEPVDDQDAWAVVQVVERRPGRPPGIGAVREFLRSQLSEDLTAKRSRAVRDVVRGQIGMVYDSTQIAWAARQFPEIRKTTRDENGVPSLEFDTTLPEIAPADTSRVLARYRGGVMTLGRFLHLYTDIQPLFRPSINTWELFRDQVDAQAFEPYMAQVARERGLDRDSMVVAQIAGKREQILVEHLYSDSILSRVTIDPKARRKYYQDHLTGFFTYARVRYAALWASSKEGADSIAARLRAGEKAWDIISADSLLGTQRGSIQERSEEEHGSYQKLLFEGLRPGGVTVEGPDRVGHYAILQSLEYLPGHQLGYDEVAEIIDETLQNTQSEALLKDFIERHRRKYRVESHPEMVMKIRLVDPTL